MGDAQAVTVNCGRTSAGSAYKEFHVAAFLASIEPSPVEQMVELTIGIPTYKDFDGVYFTVQALRIYQDLENTELLVIDNFGCEHTKRFVDGSSGARYIHYTEAVGTAAAKNRVFAEARGKAVLCCDSHVLFSPGAISRLKTYYREHPGSRDLLQGPLVYDNLSRVSTHLDPVWRGQMWGIWGTDPRGIDPDGEAFEIWGMGMGVFSCRNDAWPGFHPAFSGFGGEEGYIQEKVRQHGGRSLCLPWLRWGHRFPRPAGVPYRITVEDKFRNYLIGHLELGLDTAPVREHFSEFLSRDTIKAIAADAARATTPSLGTNARSGATAGKRASKPAKRRRKRSPDSQRDLSQMQRENPPQARPESGAGSTFGATDSLRDDLASLFRDLDIRVLSDAACGDASWITGATGDLELYLGFDTVEDLIARNLKTCDRLNHFFRLADISSDILPRSDAILCRDCLGQLPTSMSLVTISNFKSSGSTYLIATTFPNVTENAEQRTGEWRPINLTLPPYNLPDPIRCLRERPHDAGDPRSDQSLGVWRLSDL